MSPRRFFAYFLAVSAGSTVAFAPTLRGQPAPPVRDAGAALTSADAGTDALSPDAARMFQEMRNRRHHKPAARVTQARSAQVAQAEWTRP